MTNPLHVELAKSGFHHVKTTHGEAGETQHFKGRNGHKVTVSGDRWDSRPSGAPGASGSGDKELAAHLGSTYHARNPEGLSIKQMFGALLRGEAKMNAGWDRPDLSSVHTTKAGKLRTLKGYDKAVAASKRRERPEEYANAERGGTEYGSLLRRESNKENTMADKQIDE